MKRLNQIKTFYKIIILAILFGILSWIADAIIDSNVFFNKSFIDSFLLPNNIHEFYMWSIPIVLILIFAYILAKKVENLENTQTQLRDIKEWLYTTIRSIGDAIIATDKNANITIINTVAEKLTGWKREEVIGKNIQDVFNIVNEYTNEKVEIPVDKVIREGKTVGLANHTVLISKDDKRFNIDDSAAPILSNENEIIGVILTFRDVSGTKRIYRELEKSEEKFRDLFELSPFPLLVHQDGKIVIVNKATVDFMEAKDKSELIGLNILDFVHHDNKQLIIDRVKKVRDEKIPLPAADEKFITLKGHTKDVLVQGIRYSYNDRPANLVVFQDISKRKENEEKLKESEEKFRAIFDNSGFGSALLNPQGQFLLVNKGWSLISGYTQEELLKMKNSDLSHPDDNEATAIKMKELSSGEIDSFSLEKRIITKKGEIRHGILTVKPLLDSNNQSIGVC